MSPSLTSKIPFLSSSHKDDGDKLHAVEEGKASLESSKEKSIDEKRKDSASITAPAKPTPARIPSTRIQEPTRTRSQMQRNPSQLDRHKSTTSTKTGGRPERPGLQRRRTTAQTRYIDMLLGLDNVPKLHNILASFFTWVLLAGYIVFPATFKKWQTDDDLEKKADNEAKAHALATARNIPLLYIAAFACGIGVLGCLWLWWVHRKNYVWVINRVFLPALMNSIAGLISTLINVYTAQAGTPPFHSAFRRSTFTDPTSRAILGHGTSDNHCHRYLFDCNGDSLLAV